MLVGDRNLFKWTHIFIDEVHERDQGPFIKDVRKILGILDPLLPLSTIGTNLQY